MNIINPIPDDYPRISPYIIVADAAGAIKFYQDIFGASLRMELKAPDGRIAHAELEIGGSVIMLADAHPEMGAVAPSPKAVQSVSMTLYVDDVDQTVARAVEKGATIKRPVGDQFYGDRVGTIVDPFGHHWMVMSRIENVPHEETTRRFAAMFSNS